MLTAENAFENIQYFINRLLFDVPRKQACFFFFISVLDLKLQPEMPNNVYYSLSGSPFVLNCTARVGNYAQASNLTWQHNKKWLFSEVRHMDNSTVQLILSSTSSDNDGIYWCGPRLGNMSQGVNMSLIVAGN